MGYTGRHRIPKRPVPRQRPAYRIALIGLSALILPAMLLGGAELGRHGWASFVFREAGTGATAATPADLGPRPSPAPAPTAVIPSLILLVPYLQDHPRATIIVPVSAGEVLSVTPGNNGDQG